jgi:hypothetical protein
MTRPPPTRPDRRSAATLAVWTSVTADSRELAAAHAIVRAAVVNGEDPVEAIRESAEWVAPVWVRAGESDVGEADWAWGAARVLAQRDAATQARAARRRIGAG